MAKKKVTQPAEATGEPAALADGPQPEGAEALGEMTYEDDETVTGGSGYVSAPPNPLAGKWAAAQECIETIRASLPRVTAEHFQITREALKAFDEAVGNG